MSKKTVFVIGAGASAEAGLPTGDTLKDQISKLLYFKFDFHRLTTGDYHILEALKEISNDSDNTDDVNSYLNEARHISEALPLAISIDNFIDAHRDNTKIATCGKLAIVRSILDAERKSSLYFEYTGRSSNLDLTKIKNTWYIPFFKLLTENCTKDQLKKRLADVTLIIFNYDRCVEHFLINAIESYYKIKPSEAAEIVSCINILHPYGKVGNLPNLSSDSNTTHFGTEPHPTQLVQLMKGIKTFTESTEVGETLKIKTSIAEANKLVYVGFAFHKLNMELISPTSRTGKKPQCYATTYAISESDKVVISQQIRAQAGTVSEPKLANLKCGDFFNDFWRSLSF